MKVHNKSKRRYLHNESVGAVRLSGTCVYVNLRNQTVFRLAPRKSLIWKPLWQNVHQRVASSTKPVWLMPVQSTQRGGAIRPTQHAGMLHIASRSLVCHTVHNAKKRLRVTTACESMWNVMITVVYIVSAERKLLKLCIYLDLFMRMCSLPLF